MSSQHSILIYGRDTWLLTTRRLVLERTGHLVLTATEPSDVTQLIPLEQISLLILCHTLSTEECSRTLDLVHTQWPQVQTLVLTAGKWGSPLESSSEVADATEGPLKLLNAVTKLLTSEPGIQSVKKR